jgi:hypothetical protein
MHRLDPARVEELQARWTDRFVRANPERPELKRFGDRVGRVVTVNHNGLALVDFQDGAWYDVPADEGHLTLVDPAEAQKLYNPKANSAQRFPERQG